MIIIFKCIFFPVLILFRFQVYENEERFSDGAVNLIASDLTSCTDTQESLFGGDLLSILIAMRMVTNQIDNCLQENRTKVSSDLVLKVNEVSSNFIFTWEQF